MLRPYNLATILQLFLWCGVNYLHPLDACQKLGLGSKSYPEISEAMHRTPIDARRTSTHNATSL